MSKVEAKKKERSASAPSLSQLKDLLASKKKSFARLEMEVRELKSSLSKQKLRKQDNLVVMSKHKKESAAVNSMSIQIPSWDDSRSDKALLELIGDLHVLESLRKQLLERIQTAKSKIAKSSEEFSDAENAIKLVQASINGSNSNDFEALSIEVGTLQIMVDNELHLCELKNTSAEHQKSIEVLKERLERNKTEYIHFNYEKDVCLERQAVILEDKYITRLRESLIAMRIAFASLRRKGQSSILTATAEIEMELYRRDLKGAGEIFDYRNLES